MKLAIAFLAGVVTASLLLLAAFLLEERDAQRRTRQTAVPDHDPEDPGPGKTSQ